MLKFTKMNGAGNDFVMLDNREGALALDREAIARICDRHRGIGADGVLVVERAQDGADFRMRYYNADGGEAEMCGNGARCFARFANRIAGRNDAPLRFETLAGVIAAEMLGDAVRITMSEPGAVELNQVVRMNGETMLVHSVNTGVPHAVTIVEELANAAVEPLGRQVRHHTHFAPKGTNVNFAQPLGARELAVRTYERGVEAETQACGTGVVASALVFHELTGAEPPIGIQVAGGERMEVSFQKTSAGGYESVTLTGPADFVFEGEIAL